MDGNHGLGCALLGLALTLFLIRLVGLSSPPFNVISSRKQPLLKVTLVIAGIVMTLLGSILISQPMDPAVAQRVEEESFRFH